MKLDFKKIKHVYLYIGGIAATIIILYFVAKGNPEISSSANITAPPGDVTGRQMPQDQIHKGLENPIAEKPSKTNVLPSIMQHMAQLKKAVEEHPRDTAKLRGYAEFLSEAQMNDQALIYYKKILDINPRRVDVMSSMVYIYFSENNLEQAEEYLNKILSIDKNNIDALYNLGAVSANRGNRVKARELWTKIITNFPKSSLAQKARESLSQL